MIARDILSRDTTPLSQKPRLGEKFAWQVLDWKKPAANDCRVREKSEVKVRLASGKLFPGQYFDQESGAHYNYFRDYDPVIGRYTESDPIGNNGGINLYVYALVNPVMLIDYFGLKCCTPQQQTDMECVVAMNTVFYMCMRISKGKEAACKLLVSRLPLPRGTPDSLCEGFKLNCIKVLQRDLKKCVKDVCV